MKLKSVYICESCQFQSTKWVGKCPSCNSWNSFHEDVINVGKKDEVVRADALATVAEKATIHALSEEVKKKSEGRISSQITEFDTVLGGGFVPGSIHLLGGEPGIGKSTLTLQVTDKIDVEKVVYVSGEESAGQVSQRGKRLGLKLEGVEFVEGHNIEEVIAILTKIAPGFVIIDSIQVMQSDNASGYAGSISQIRYCTELLMHFGKQSNTTILIIGHVNKEGNLAGPKILEHLVDCVSILEGDRYSDMRALRCMKNRYGSTSEVGLFSMTEKGLSEVKNPSLHLLKDRSVDAIGSCLSVIMEGTRPLVVEVQALTNTTAFGYPKRAANGYDMQRLQMITAIIQKYTDVNLLNQDVYINVIGGIKVQDPAVDLAVALAIISSYKKKALPHNIVALGELGLSSEIRNVTRVDARKKECKKLGLEALSGHKKLVDILALF